jgi:hypothetical protein
MLHVAFIVFKFCFDFGVLYLVLKIKVAEFEKRDSGVACIIILVACRVLFVDC